MKKENIFLNDWERILIGNAPTEFLLEVFIRTTLIYLFLLIILRLLGKRMNGQLTNLEMAVMLTLGAIVSPAMQLPDRGLLSGVLALLCALTFLRVSNLWGFKSNKAEQVIQGTETMLVKDGIIQLHTMAKNRLSHQQIYAALRNKKVYNLSKVKRLYLEAYGLFSIYEDSEDRPGLSVFPPNDQEIQSIHQRPKEASVACSNCGYTVRKNEAPATCPCCEAKQWVEAVI
ncbi:YetF domain-containing protein [Larkinella insperata]|uniref:YetF domain-containing protein n=1 Tax=Larkinella insperata TaxID=332158 RepID=A0ABW3Q3M0_9BACT|nr:YetF domain-containing protein [Larkinella insperata]